MTFSGALTLTDLNDFITPSQACIKPVEQSNLPSEDIGPGAAATQIHIDSSGSYYEVPQVGTTTSKTVNGTSTAKKLETAQISLNDCLACSGCITSAESVLITLQSHTEVRSFLSSNPPPSSSSHKIPVLSIAPQSLASLAASLSSSSNSPISLRQILRRVRTFCTQSLGFAHVYDTTFARHIALLEHAHEFAERKKGGGAHDARLPMLASACPGWVCYAEKTHAEMLPFISRTKSPQQIMGTLVKNWLGEKWGEKPDEIYHVTVMPCYDKKLEASRQDFYNETYATRDVDCVITTGELDLMMREKGWDLSIAVAGENDDSDPIDVDVESLSHLPELLSHPGTSSGSYLHYIMASLQNPSSPYASSVRTIRTSDYEEYTLTDTHTGAIIFRGAKCYGFRNLQNVVRKVGREAGVQVGRGAAGRLAKVRRGKEGEGEKERERAYDYVEVMACPGGCVNGGGQLKPRSLGGVDQEGFQRDWESSGVAVVDGGSGDIAGGSANARWGDKEWTKKVEKAYWHDLPTPPASRPSSPLPFPGRDGHDAVDRLASSVLRGLCKPKSVSDLTDLAWPTVMDEEAELRRVALFRTQYHAVESDVVGLAVKW